MNWKPLWVKIGVIDSRRGHRYGDEDQERGGQEQQSSHRGLQLRREVDMQARAAGNRKRLRDVDAQCYDGEADPETDAGRIFDRIPEMIESVAVVEEGGDPEIMG